jgi:hypothetical protein
MLVIASIIASRYYNGCTDGRTSPGNYGYPLADTKSSIQQGTIYKVIKEEDERYWILTRNPQGKRPLGKPNL